MSKSHRMSGAAAALLLAGMASQAAAQTDPAVQRLVLIQSTVAGICTTISDKGNYVQGEVGGSIEAKLSKFIPKFIDAGGKVDAKVSGARWNGISQAGMATALQANMACRAQVTAELVKYLTLPPTPSSPPPPSAAPSPPKKGAAPAAAAPAAAPLTKAERLRQATAAATAAAKKGNFPAALASWERAADLGDAQAQFEAAQIYDYGAKGVPMNCAKATRRYKQEAASGLTAAKYNVGGEYYYGCKGLFAADWTEALKWLTQAADEGSPEAEYEIGMIYYNGGNGVPRDRAKARTWLTKASDHKYRLASEALRNFQAG